MLQSQGYREPHEIEMIRRQMTRLCVDRGQQSKPAGRSNWIFDEIEQRLATGVYLFDSEIVTLDLVREFNSSRAPVTMAMNMLQAAGYVTIRPQIGIRVVAPSDEEIAGYFVLYARSEGLHTAAATQRASKDGLSMLVRISSVIEQAEIEETIQSRREQLILSSLFHEQIRSMAGTPWLCQHSASAWRMSNFLLANRLVGNVTLMRERAAEYRRRLIRLMLAAEGDAAGRLMEEFINSRCRV